MFTSYIQCPHFKGFHVWWNWQTAVKMQFLAAKVNTDHAEWNGSDGNFASNCREQPEPLSLHQRRTPNTITLLNYTLLYCYEQRATIHIEFFVFLQCFSHMSRRGTLPYLILVCIFSLRSSPWVLECGTCSRKPGWFWQWCAWVFLHWLNWSCPEGQKSNISLSWLPVLHMETSSQNPSQKNRRLASNKSVTQSK